MYFSTWRDFLMKVSEESVMMLLSETDLNMRQRVEMLKVTKNE